MKLEPYSNYLQQTVIPARLACRTSDGWPVVLSLWYLYREGALYCATQTSAKIVANLRQDPRCAYEIASDLPPYCGIRGKARAQILPELGEGVLAELLHRYLGGTNNPLARTLLKQQASEVAIQLEPISVYAWNFTQRMQGTEPMNRPKPCPDTK